MITASYFLPTDLAGESKTLPLKSTTNDKLLTKLFDKGFWVSYSECHSPHNGVVQVESPSLSISSDKTSLARLYLVDLAAEECESCNSFCNDVLWCWLQGSHVQFECNSSREWKAFEKVNEIFANKIIKIVKDNKWESRKEVQVWIHDYPLSLAAIKLRKAIEEESLPCRLGFLLHAPFLHQKLLDNAPWSKKILEGLLACHIVGFQRQEDCNNFVASCQRTFQHTIDESNQVITVGEREVRLKCFPEDASFLKYVNDRLDVNDENNSIQNYSHKSANATTSARTTQSERLLRSSLSECFNDYLENIIEKGRQVALLLDYDGTLTPITSHPDLACLPPDTRDVLDRLSKNPSVFVAIISGRSLSNVRNMVGIDGITYAGNHGLEIIHKDGIEYTHALSDENKSKMSAVLKELESQCCEEGAWVENKDITLTFHYRSVPIDKREHLISRAESLILNSGLKLGHAHCALECKPEVTWNKGTASLYILQNAFGDNWLDKSSVIYIGDDKTDEDAISILKGKGFTFRVSSNDHVATAADRILNDTGAVLEVLQWVETKYRPSSS